MKLQLRPENPSNWRGHYDTQEGLSELLIEQLYFNFDASRNMPTVSAEWEDAEQGLMQLEGHTGDRRNHGNFAQRITFTLRGGGQTRHFEGNINPSFSRISGQYHDEDTPEKSFFFEFKLEEKVKGTLRLMKSGQKPEDVEPLEI